MLKGRVILVSGRSPLREASIQVALHSPHMSLSLPSFTHPASAHAKASMGVGLLPNVESLKVSSRAKRHGRDDGLYSEIEGRVSILRAGGSCFCFVFGRGYDFKEDVIPYFARVA